jgi:hypothetical protein
VEAIASIMYSNAESILDVREPWRTRD